MWQPQTVLRAYTHKMPIHACVHTSIHAVNKTPELGVPTAFGFAKEGESEWMWIADVKDGRYA